MRGPARILAEHDAAVFEHLGERDPFILVLLTVGADRLGGDVRQLGPDFGRDLVRRRLLVDDGQMRADPASSAARHMADTHARIASASAALRVDFMVPLQGVERTHVWRPSVRRQDAEHAAAFRRIGGEVDLALLVFAKRHDGDGLRAGSRDWRSRSSARRRTTEPIVCR